MNVVDNYIERFEPEAKIELNRIRSIVKNLLPESEESIYYGMPTVKYKGKPILGFDAHKNHIGIYPFSGSVISKIDELKDYSSTKGALRENLDKLLPVDLIIKIVQERLRQLSI
jgi:uncharacterized protein YdhG (YjbR/CyaY superfamily)